MAKKNTKVKKNKCTSKDPIIEALRESQALGIGSNKIAPHPIIQPKIEEIKKYAHTRFGSRYLKARLLFDSGKHLFFHDAEQRDGIQKMAEAYMIEEKACIFSTNELLHVEPLLKKDVGSGSPTIETMSSFMLAAFLSPDLEFRILVLSHLETSYRTLELLGSWYCFEQKWDKALDCFLKAYQLDPDAYENYYSVGVVYKNLKNYDEAIAWLNRYIDRSEMQDFKRPSAHYELAFMAVTRQDLDEAFRQVELARAALVHRIPFLPPVNTDSQTMVEMMVSTLPRPKHSSSTSVPLNEETLEHKPDDGLSTTIQTELKEKGNEYFKKGEMIKAIRCYSQALDRGSAMHAVLHSNLSVANARLGQLTEALYHANQSIASDPYFAKGYGRKAVALQKLNRRDEAELNAAICLALCPSLSSDKELIAIKPTSEIVLIRKSLDLNVSLLNHHNKEIICVITDEALYSLSAVISKPVKMIGIGRNQPKIIKGVLPFIFQVSSSRCYFENLCLSDVVGQALYVEGRGSLVKAKNCTFRNSSGAAPIVACGNGGRIELADCTICDSKQAGGIMANDPDSFLYMNNCKVYDCAKAAVEVVNFAKATLENCELFSCSQGIIGYDNGELIKVNDTKIYQHMREGVLISQKCTIVLDNVSIFKNKHLGLSVDNTGNATVNNCNIYSNSFQGVSVKGSSSLNMRSSTVSDNMCGGIRIGINYESPVLIENCTVANNRGPGIHDELTKGGSMDTSHVVKSLTALGISIDQNQAQKLLKQASTSLTKGSSKPLLRNNTVENNREINTHPCAVAKDEKRCSYCLKQQEKYARCSRCQTVLYCDGHCQKRDWPKHKVFCSTKKDKHRNIQIDLNNVTRFDPKTVLRITSLSPNLKKRQENKKGKYLDGQRFIVKIQTTELNCDQDQKLHLYDESRELNISFANRELYQIISECGILGANQLTSKKVFLYATYKDQNQLRIAVHELAPYQKW